jgi:hypothetical protein
MILETRVLRTFCLRMLECRLTTYLNGFTYCNRHELHRYLTSLRCFVHLWTQLPKEVLDLAHEKCVLAHMARYIGMHTPLEAVIIVISVAWVIPSPHARCILSAHDRLLKFLARFSFQKFSKAKLLLLCAQIRSPNFIGVRDRITPL